MRAGRDRGRERNRQQGAEQPIDGEGNRRAQRRPEKRADQRHDHELDEREADNARSGRADRLENGERRAFALDKALRRVRDANPADDQRQQSRQRQEFGEAVEVATEVRVDGETRASVPAGLGEGPLRLPHESLDGGIVGRAVHDDARRPSDQRARLDQFRCIKRRLRNEHARPQAHASGQPIRLADQEGPNHEIRLANANDTAELEVEPSQQRLFHRGAEHPVPLAERVFERHRRREGCLADTRPRRLDSFDFDQSRIAARHSRHATQGRDRRQ